MVGLKVRPEGKTLEEVGRQGKARGGGLVTGSGLYVTETRREQGEAGMVGQLVVNVKIREQGRKRRGRERKTKKWNESSR